MKLKQNVFFGILFFLAAVAYVFGAPPEGSTRRFGIFIGSNNGGKDRVTLRYAVSDASSVSKVFYEMGGIADEDSVLLVEPNIRDINRRIDALHEQVIRSRGIYKRTEIVFYYSGHSDEEGLLLNRERYPYRELRDRINNIPSDMRIVILDSCASGAFTRLKGGAKTQPFLMDNSITADGYAFLTSSSADEASQESDRINASYFTHSLVAGLRGAADSVGDGRVTLNELYRFAYSETLARTETSVYGTQHPSYDIQISGTGDLVLTDVKETSAGMVFDEKLTGRLSVRNSSDHLIAEITKVAVRPLELGLEPGLYRVTLQQGSDLLSAEILLVEGKRTLVTWENFVFISADSARRRGGEEPDSLQEKNIYTFFLNVVNEPFHFPLIGFVNIHKGNHEMAQVGFVNINTGNFSGAQIGYTNTVAGDVMGAQVGFVNTANGELTGAQAGFVNAANGKLFGAQAGFVNAANGELTGAQVGFVNTVKKEMTGPQIGFVNIASKGIKGVQLGCINYADTIENGIPIGFISIVRKGGYHAVEYSFSEFYPINTGLKLGVEKFYTTLLLSFNPSGESSYEKFATGAGIGSIIPIGKNFFLNPELISLSSFYWNIDGEKTQRGTANLTSFIPYMGLNFGRHFSISAGLSVTWVHAYSIERANRKITVVDHASPPKPLFSIFSHDFDNYSSVVIGARAALRLQF